MGENVAGKEMRERNLALPTNQGSVFSLVLKPDNFFFDVFVMIGSAFKSFSSRFSERKIDFVLQFYGLASSPNLLISFAFFTKISRLR